MSADMAHQHLGRSGLQVSRIALGTMVFGFTADEPTSFAIMDAAVDAGINLFDTADVYGGPQSPDMAMWEIEDQARTGPAVRARDTFRRSARPSCSMDGTAAASSVAHCAGLADTRPDQRIAQRANVGNLSRTTVPLIDAARHPGPRCGDRERINPIDQEGGVNPRNPNAARLHRC